MLYRLLYYFYFSNLFDNSWNIYSRVTLFRPPDFKECVVMVREILFFALLTQVEGDANRALVSSSNDRISMALSANEPFMDNCADLLVEE